MSVSSLPATTTPPATQSAGVGGIVPTNFQIPAMPAVHDGGQLFDNRMEATKLLMNAGTGNLKGGGKKNIKKTKYKKSRNHIVKVMRGCNNKKTKKNKMIFRGGANLITPSITGGKIEVSVPVGASQTQTSVLSNLTTQFLKAQVLNSNIPPPIPAIIPSKFVGGGNVNRSRYKNRKTNQKRLRYKKSIGRRSRSRSRSRRRHYKHRR
jgi:hypothetical protein